MPIEKKHYQDLCELFMSAKSKQEIAVILEDLLTPQELESLAERWQIVLRLSQGKTQRNVAQELGISIAKVTRGARAMKYGTGAFAKFAERLKKVR